jgi:hypothetical protein
MNKRVERLPQAVQRPFFVHRRVDAVQRRTSAKGDDDNGPRPGGAHAAIPKRYSRTIAGATQYCLLCNWHLRFNVTDAMHPNMGSGPIIGGTQDDGLQRSDRACRDLGTGCSLI